MCSGVRLTRKQLTSKPDHSWPELWKTMGKNAKLKEKHKWSHEKFHLDNAWKLWGIYFIDLEDKELKETIKNARKKLKHQWLPSCPVQFSSAKRIVGVVRPMKSNQNLRVFRKRWSMKQGRWAQKFISPNFWTHVIWKMLNWKQSTQNTNPKCYCKRGFGVLCSIHWTRIISITNNNCKNHGYHLQTALLRRTSNWRNIFLYSGKMEDAPKFQNRNVQTFGFVHHDTT